MTLVDVLQFFKTLTKSTLKEEVGKKSRFWCAYPILTSTNLSTCACCWTNPQECIVFYKYSILSLTKAIKNLWQTFGSKIRRVWIKENEVQIKQGYPCFKDCHFDFDGN